jgi:hypothetical protein
MLEKTPGFICIFAGTENENYNMVFSLSEPQNSVAGSKLNNKKNFTQERKIPKRDPFIHCHKLSTPFS